MDESQRSEPVTMTADEHTELYAEHKARALGLRLMIDEGLIGGLDPTKHARMTGEYLDEVACMTHHYTMARLARELET